MKKFLILQKREEHFWGVYLKKERHGLRASKPQAFSEKELRGKSFALIKFFPELYFGRETFPKSPPEILELQIRERLKNLEIFETTPFVAYLQEEDLGAEVEIAFCAISNIAVNSILASFGKIEARPLGLFPAQLATAYLSLKETDEDVLSVFASDDCFYITATGHGRVHFIRNIEVDPVIGITESQVEEALLAALDFSERILGLQLKGIICYGSRRELITENSEQVYEPGFAFIKNVEKEDLILYPHLYGAIFVPEELSLLPKDYKIFLKHFNIARKLAFSLIFLSLINYGIWFYYTPKKDRLTEEIQLLERDYRKKFAELKKLFPPEKANLFQQYVDTQRKYLTSFHLDDFLIWLSQITPPEVKINSLEGEVKKPSSKNRKRTEINTNYFNIKLKVIIYGNIEKTKQTSNKLIKKLLTKIDIEENNFEYDYQTKQGILEVKGLYKFQNE